MTIRDKILDALTMYHQAFCRRTLDTLEEIDATVSGINTSGGVLA